MKIVLILFMEIYMWLFQAVLALLYICNNKIYTRLLCSICKYLFYLEYLIKLIFIQDDFLIG